MRKEGPWLAAMIALLTPVSAGADESPGAGPSDGWDREDKALALNLAAAGGVVAWGVANWDYGESGPSLSDEGWFGRTTEEGGADKLGHLYSAYALSHLFANAYERFGYAGDRAGTLGALSSVGVTTLIEIGDSFSPTYGFSYQDALMNVAGAAIGQVLWTHPELDRKLDLRVEYDPFSGDAFKADVFTDYERLKYLLAVKADGSEAATSPVLRALELHIGYFTRGYDDFSPDGQDERRRALYIGVGLDLRHLLRPVADVPVLDYLQVPYTDVTIDADLD